MAVRWRTPRWARRGWRPFPPAQPFGTIPSVRGREDAVVDDRELAARMVAGDAAALREVYDRYAGLVFGLARRVLCDDALAEDVTQEVFVSVWERPERF